MAFVDGGSGCQCKEIKTLRTQETSVLPPAAEQEGGKVAQQVCVTSVTPAAFNRTSLAAPSCQVSVFGSFLCGNVCAICASIWSRFSSSGVCGKHNQREKSMYPQAIKKSIAFIESIFSAEWCRNSQLCPAAICRIDPFFPHSFICHSLFHKRLLKDHTSVKAFLIFVHLTQVWRVCVYMWVCLYMGGSGGGAAADGNGTI